MPSDFAPVGAALPPRRDSFVTAAAADPAAYLGGIIVPEARDRLLELIEREQLPQDVRGTLSGALGGDLRRQQLLFQAMVDTWPRLQKCIGEVKRAARKAPWKIQPWAPRGEKPGREAESLAKEVEAAVWGMKPDPIRGRKGFEGTIEALVEGYYFGHQVQQIHWSNDTGEYLPLGSRTMPPRFYGYPCDGAQEDRLMLDRQGGKTGFQQLEDFPRNQFLVAVHGGHPGHASIAAPLRALTGYWLAAIYGLKWFMSFAQLFGQPIRWAEYAAGNETAKKEIVAMMQRIGTEAWGIFPHGTKLNFVEAGRSASAMPQYELLKIADEQCEVFILGQTLTSSQGDSGARALGEVHMSVRQDVIEGVCDFAGEVLSYQLAPAIVELNYGEAREDTPGIWAVFEKPKDEKALAERDRILVKELGMPVGKTWLYERHGVPVPADGEDLFEGTPQADPAGEPALPGQRTKENPAKPKPAGVEAKDGALATVDQLAGNVLEGLTGVTREWLSPVRPFFARLAALALANQVTDDDFLAALQKAQGQLPELFDVLDTGALQNAFEEAIGSALLDGSSNRYE